MRWLRHSFWSPRAAQSSLANLDGRQRDAAETARLDVLARVAECLIFGNDMDAMLSEAFDLVAEELGNVTFASYVVDRNAKGEYLSLTASRGLRPEEQHILQVMDIEPTIAGQAVLGRKSIVLEHVEDSVEPLTRLARLAGVRAYAAFPLMATTGVLGVVSFGSLQASTWKPEQLTLMQTVTAQVAAAMERIRLERAARDSETSMRLALEINDMGAWSWDWGSNTLRGDHEFVRLHGLEPSAHPVFYRPAMLFAHVHPDDRDGLLLAARICAEEGADLRYDYRVLRSDGSQLWLTSRGRKVANSEGRTTSLIGLTQDISQEMMTRVDLEREAAELESLAESRAIQLASTEDRLARAARMEALGRLAGGIAHDFNNVLQAIESSNDLALVSVDHDPDAVRRYVRLSADACARGASVTERLLAFGRQSALRTTAIDPAELLESLRQMLVPVLGRHISMEVVCASGVPCLIADRHRLEAVLINTANNARDAMPHGGRLTLAADLSSLREERTGSGRKMVRLRIIDEGEGMAPEVLRRVSEPFFTTKPTGKGTGLGLAMARGFAEQSGGEIRIESRLGAGTTVTLLLPAADPAWVCSRDPNLQAGPILVVEEQEDIRKALTADGSSDREIRSVSTAEAAIALIDHGYHPAVLVAELALAGPLDGLDLLGRARERLGRLPAIIINGPTTESAAGRLQAAEEGGRLAFLRKPLTPESLRQRLNRVLAQDPVKHPRMPQ